MIQTNLLGRKARLKGTGAMRGPSSRYTLEIVGVYLEDSVPCVLLLGTDGGLHAQLVKDIQVKEQEQ